MLKCIDRLNKRIGNLEQIKAIIKQMIAITDEELNSFLSQTNTRRFERYSILSEPEVVPNEIFFIEKGLVRVIVTDTHGTEHTIHFALENQFICDYAAFILNQPSFYRLQALEQTDVVVLPRNCIAWGYKHLNEGNKMGRLIAEQYFIYQDNRLRNNYARSPKELYGSISNVFPNIHNRVPQHMIASYLGISPVHLSRLKRADTGKV